MPIDFKSCREKIGAIQEFCNRWCKCEHVESNALNNWKLNIFKIINGRISFYCNNLDLLPPIPKYTFRNLKKGIQEFHMAAKFGVFIDEDQTKLPTLYWLPKLHKRPYVSCFITNSSLCTTTKLATRAVQT